jgi:hypothetical protein
MTDTDASNRVRAVLLHEFIDRDAAHIAGGEARGRRRMEPSLLRSTGSQRPMGYDGRIGGLTLTISPA